MFLNVEGINKGFGEGDSRVEVLKDVSFGVEKGEMCVMLGPSGSGKSTLLNIVGGIETADSGSITVGEDRLESLSEKGLSLYRRKHLGYIFQSYNLIGNLTVKENIEVGRYLGENPLPVDSIIKGLGLWEHKDKLPNQISGGQQQRTAIGRAIIKNPDVLLCDEPTGALDYATSKEILKLISQVSEEYGTTVLMVTHNDAIKLMADKVIKLHDGRIGEVITNSVKVRPEDIEW